MFKIYVQASLLMGLNTIYNLTLWNVQTKYPLSWSHYGENIVVSCINSEEDPDACVRLCGHQSKYMVRESDW